MLVKAFHDATNEFTITKAKVFRPVPGWNDFCKDKYKAAREAFLTRKIATRCAKKCHTRKVVGN